MQTLAINHAIILAGGYGKRLRTKVQDVPKPMAIINEKPFLEILLNYLNSHDLKNVTLAIGYKRDIIKNHFNHKYKKINISFSEEDENFPLGTGGALLNSLNSIPKNTPFLVLNGDTFFNFDLQNFSRACDNANADVGIALMCTKDSRYGKVDLNKNGQIKTLHNNNQRNNLYSPAIGGTYYFKEKKLFESVNSVDFLNLEKDLLPTIRLKHPNFYGKIFKDEFVDIGTPKDYQRASKFKGIKFFSNY